MNIKGLLTAALISILMINQAYSQFNYSMKVESGFLKYQFNTVQVDPGPNWRGYYLHEGTGIDFNIVNSINFKNKLFAGIGIAYLNFEGINGLSAFQDFEYLPFKTKLSPLINLKIGYSHIWNQYDKGTGTGLTELCGGLNYKLSEKIHIYAKSGFTMTQESFLIPVKCGIRFCNPGKK